MSENYMIIFISSAALFSCLFFAAKIYLEKNQKTMSVGVMTRDRKYAVIKVIIQFYFPIKNNSLNLLPQNILTAAQTQTSSLGLEEIMAKKDDIARAIKKELVIFTSRTRHRISCIKITSAKDAWNDT